MGKLKQACLVLVLVFSIPAVLAAGPRGGTTKSAVPSQAWNSPRGATGLLNQIRCQAREIQDAVDPLNLTARYNLVDFETQSDALNDIRAQVNEMGRDLKRLEDIRESAQPWQQSEIDRIMPIAAALAKDTQDAIQLLNKNLTRSWASPLPSEYATLEQDASQIARSVKQAETVAKLKYELDQQHGS